MPSFRRPLTRMLPTLLAALAACSLGNVPVAGEEDHWPRFRGPGARGVADGASTPVTWNVETGAGILWKTPVDGLGHSSPVIWGDTVFLTTAVSGNETDELRVGLYGDVAPVEDEGVIRWEVWALDKDSGKVLWKKVAHEGVPKIKRHTKATHANSSPATDGKHVVAMFGAEGLYAYDMKGKLLWKKDLGVLDSGFFMMPQAQWGFGSSPVIHDGMVILQVDVQKDSFLAAYDVETGEPVWRTPREEVPGWSSPTVHRDGVRSQVIVNGWKHIGGYDLKSGEEIWRMSGAGDIPTPTPYVAHDLIFLTSAHGGAIPVYAVKTDARGDISLEEGETSNEHIAWSDLRGGSYMPTSLVYGDEIYILRDNGILTCRDARTGKEHYKQRIEEAGNGYTASLVAGDGKIYVTSETGDITVVKAGTEFESLSTNAMNEVCMATPALSGGALFVRTRAHLVAIGGSGPQSVPEPGKASAPADVEAGEGAGSD